MPAQVQFARVSHLATPWISWLFTASGNEEIWALNTKKQQKKLITVWSEGPWINVIHSLSIQAFLTDIHKRHKFHLSGVNREGSWSAMDGVGGEWKLHILRTNIPKSETKNKNKQTDNKDLFCEIQERWKEEGLREKRKKEMRGRVMNLKLRSFMT